MEDAFGFLGVVAVVFFPVLGVVLAEFQCLLCGYSTPGRHSRRAGCWLIPPSDVRSIADDRSNINPSKWVLESDPPEGF